MHNECFGDNSDMEEDKEADSFWEKFGAASTTSSVHKLYAIWEAQGCDGAISNCGLMPYEVAQWESIKSHMEAEYQKSFLEAAAEIWSRKEAPMWWHNRKDDLQATTGPHFVAALLSLKPSEISTLSDDGSD